VKAFFDKFFKSLDDAGKAIWDFLNPTNAFSWRTLIFLSLFSWSLMLALGGLPVEVVGESASNGETSRVSPVQSALFFLGWIFLNLGIGWGFAKDAQGDKKKSKIKIPLLDIEFFPGAWITAGLTCCFLFRVWDPEWRSLALLSWPIVTAIYAAIPKIIPLITSRKPPEPQVRQDLLLLALLHTMLSCWIGFYLLIQSWITVYPPLLGSASGIRRSMFLVAINPGPTLLDTAEARLREQFAEEALPIVRSQLENSEFIATVTEQVQQQVATAQQFNLNLRIFAPLGDDSPFRLQAVWQKTGENRASYYLEKRCSLRPEMQPSGTPQVETPSATRIRCEPPILLRDLEKMT
jgi:hypothetical protein